MDPVNVRNTHVVILGGGPGGYEAALVAAHLGGRVTLVESTGIGGAAVLTDCVPSKALISTADYLSEFETAHDLGVHLTDHQGDEVVNAEAELAEVNRRVLALAKAQSADIGNRLAEVGVRVVQGWGRMVSATEVHVDLTEGGQEQLAADVVLLATGAAPRVMATAQPDGEHVLPSGDQDAAKVIEEVFLRRGMTVLSKARMAAVERTDDGVIVHLEDGRAVAGWHALLAVGAVPLTRDIGLEEIGVELSPSGHIVVDRVSRTSVRGVYAAGDCTGVLPLASVAAQQGRLAMSHALGDAVAPLPLHYVSSNIFTDPEIASVGVSQADIDSGRVRADVITLPLGRNARAKMLGIADGFVKLFAHRGSGLVLGGVVVAPSASELIFPVTLAVTHRLNVDQVASTFTVYPSLSGSIAEAARRLHVTD